MELKSFVGARKPLDGFDIPRLAHRINVSEDHLRAFLEVEARSRGYDREGRPVMLFEPHVFYRNLPDDFRQTAVDQGLAYRKWGEKSYPSDSYPRLIQAQAIHEVAALKSCSIGLSQVLVENYSSVGYRSPEDMWKAFMDDEEEHVEAMIKFVLANGIDDDLRAGRWATVARVYNGPGYARNEYDEKLAAAYAKFRQQKDYDWSPDVPDSGVRAVPDASTVKSVQARLKELGYPEAGAADGAWGTKTRAAVLAFRADRGLPIAAQIDEELLSALMVAPQRPIGSERAQATTKDLRDAGSRSVAVADSTEGAGWLVAAGGGLAGVSETLDKFNVTSGGLNEFVQDSALPLIETIKNASPYLLLALGAFVVYQQWTQKKVRLQDHREAKNVGR